ncbi:family 43 glycosylhydrolase [Mucisphaera calidilacus]|uniref:Intracellular endo-alpha-(1->5)-L-arabinanase n=1 Tax=Mucisphaera calidilacus TaxID=2527982 RepID=A0A518BUM4_9BACT|nr:family 43 glycosylhydrolase [Mucisphaera calidilacus]QDU70690.1 Intracellular endo-alpha-(1->5)-L-arabinanase [Mucisphaera calidilacus]
MKRDCVPRLSALRPVYDPSPSADEPWYINDHAIIRDRAGVWHMIGITHREPADPFREVDFAHATAPSVTGPWRREAHALTADPEAGETHLWAPHIIHHEGHYWMFYCAGGEDHTRYRLHLATSEDLFSWERHAGNPLIVDGFDARDPMVCRTGDCWTMYYTGTERPEGGRHAVLAATSTDLIRWSGRRVVFCDERSGTFGGPCESPFVLERGGWWYLFIGPRQLGEAGEDPYNTTGVYRSGDPHAFAEDQRVAMLPAHAAEVVRDGERWYITHCGWGQGGLHLAELVWGKG